jgi:hypothetical protein
LRGGIGEFRSPTPTGLYASALAAPGLSTAESQLVCVGSAVPVPDWTGYLSDPSVIPTECVDTVTTVAISPHPNATIFDPGFTAPRAWRGSLGIQRRVLGTFTISLDASYARGVSQYGFRDLNLASSPSFTLAAEGDRPVYVPAAGIVPGTGALSLTDSRVDPEFGQVLEIESNLASDTKQVTAAIGGITGRGATFQLSYTYTRAHDQSSFSGGGATQGFAAATTAGDPNLREWATSNFERRHSVLATITYPVTGGLGGAVYAAGRLRHQWRRRAQRPRVHLRSGEHCGPRLGKRHSIAARDGPIECSRLPRESAGRRGGPELVPRSVAAFARLPDQLAPELVWP